ncbi:hypothetical protein [Burkholderia ubonensis]|uniref:hypothetical protein n=1 Tax=Burkholderia ubonensis TaxID=101571 RepID=UPI0009B322B1|nr:hypothetical protein [Burkholderia ubonensis]
MLRSLLLAGPPLSRGLIRAIAAATVLVYWGIYAKAAAFLPEFVFRDAEKIQSQIGGSGTYDGTSFDAVARFYAMLGETGTHLFVATIGALCIWRVIGHGTRVGSMLACLVLLAPCVFFNLFVASKDTIVVLMAIALAGIAQRRQFAVTLAAAVMLYAGYAALVRSYFALIVAIALVALVFRHVSWRGKVWLALAVPAALFVLPNDAYYLLQHPRDMAADYLAYGSPFGARTSFRNPMEPVSFAAFCANYLYGMVRLNLPALFMPGPKEIAMQVFVWIALASVWRRTRGVSRSYEPLACLAIGHVAVSMLFEPDLGSYTRHLSSVALFCAMQFAGRAGRGREASRVVNGAHASLVLHARATGSDSRPEPARPAIAGRRYTLWKHE